MGNAFVPNDTLMNSCGVPGTGVVNVGYPRGKCGIFRGSIWKQVAGLCYHGNFRNRNFCLILYLDDTGNLLMESFTGFLFCTSF